MLYRAKCGARTTINLPVASAAGPWQLNVTVLKHSTRSRLGGICIEVEVSAVRVPGSDSEAEVEDAAPASSLRPPLRLAVIFLPVRVEIRTPSREPRPPSRPTGTVALTEWQTCATATVPVPQCPTASRLPVAAWQVP